MSEITDLCAVVWDGSSSLWDRDGSLLDNNVGASVVNRALDETRVCVRVSYQ